MYGDCRHHEYDNAENLWHHRDNDILRPMGGECHGHDIAENLD